MKTLRTLYCIFVLCCIIISGFPASVHAQNKEHKKAVLHKAQPEPPLNQKTAIEDWQAWLELARLQSYTGKYRDSLDSYAKVLKEKPGLVQARLERAKVLVWADRTQDAWTELTALPEKDLDSESLLILGELHAARKDYDRALEIFQSHLEKKPDDLEVRLKTAEILSWAGRYDESIRQYKMLVAELPDDIQIRRKYAFVLSWTGRHDKAIEQLRQTLPGNARSEQ